MIPILCIYQIQKYCEYETDKVAHNLPTIIGNGIDIQMYLRDRLMKHNIFQQHIVSHSIPIRCTSSRTKLNKCKFRISELRHIEFFI